jgi:hypothetical protein
MRALLAPYDKTGLIDFAQGLPVTGIGDVTCFPEIHQAKELLSWEH